MDATVDAVAPQFHVPCIPDLIKISRPNAPRKMPSAGYDARTLRKQLDALYTEVEERYQIQVMLHQQNAELKVFAGSLLESNRENASCMKQQMTKLHSELANLHRERYTLANKLQTIQNSQQLLDQIGAEIHHSEMSKLEVEELRKEAQSTLVKAKAENEELEIALQNKEEKLQCMNQYLDDHRERVVEERNDDLADTFYYSNKNVLRNAYERFRLSVTSRLRLESTGNCIKKVHHNYLRMRFWKIWIFFVVRRRMLHGLTFRMQRSSLGTHWQHWRIYAAVSVYVRNRTLRYYLCRTIFGRWLEYTKEQLWERDADAVCVMFEERKLCRFVFRTWRSTCMLLNWSSEWTEAKCANASRYFLGRLVQHWRRVTENSLNIFSSISSHLVCAKAMQSWKHMTSTIQYRRIQLLRQFYGHCRWMLESKRVNHRKYCMASTMHTDALKRYALCKLRQYVRFDGLESHSSTQALERSEYNKSLLQLSSTLGDTHADNNGMGRFQLGSDDEEDELLDLPLGDTNASAWSLPASQGRVSSVGYSQSAHFPRSQSAPALRFPPMISQTFLSQTFSTSSFTGLSINKTHSLRNSVLFTMGSVRQRKVTRDALYLWREYKIRSKRQLLAVQVADHNNRFEVCRKALLLWNKHIRCEKRYRFIVTQEAVQDYFGKWRDAFSARRKERAAMIFLDRRNQHLVIQHYAAWMSWMRSRRVIRKCALGVQRNTHRHIRRTAFQKWRCRWGSILFQQEREMAIENQRYVELCSLRKRQISDLQHDCDSLQSSSGKLSDAVTAMQESTKEKDVIIFQQGQLLERQEHEKKVLDEELRLAKEELQQAQQERDRLSAVEKILEKDRAQQDIFMEEKRLEADRIIRSLEGQSRALREEVVEVRQQAYLAEKTAQLSVEKEDIRLKETLDIEESLRKEEVVKKKTLENLENARADLQYEMESTQMKIRKLKAPSLDSGVEVSLGKKTGYENARNVGEGVEAELRHRSSVIRVLEGEVRECESRIYTLTGLLDEKREETRHRVVESIQEDEQRELHELDNVRESLQAKELSEMYMPAPHSTPASAMPSTIFLSAAAGVKSSHEHKFSSQITELGEKMKLKSGAVPLVPPVAPTRNAGADFNATYPTYPGPTSMYGLSTEDLSHPVDLRNTSAVDRAKVTHSSNSRADIFQADEPEDIPHATTGVSHHSPHSDYTPNHMTVLGTAGSSELDRYSSESEELLKTHDDSYEEARRSIRLLANRLGKK